MMMPQLWNQQQILAKWVLIPSLAIVCYVNSCWGGFVFDDIEAVVSNRDVNPGSSLTDVFTNDFWGTNVFKNSSHKSYRPLTILTFYWNFWLAGGLNPVFFHLTNVLLHPIVCILYYEVCQRLCTCAHRTTTEWTLCPLIASLVFAVHPVHTESVGMHVPICMCNTVLLVQVAGVVGRAELTSAVFYFLALLCYIRGTTHNMSMLYTVVHHLIALCVVKHIGMMWSVFTTFVAVALAGCAMLFKEQGLTVLVSSARYLLRVIDMTMYYRGYVLCMMCFTGWNSVYR